MVDIIYFYLGEPMNTLVVYVKHLNLLKGNTG